MSRVTFTKEHFEEMKKLYVDLSFKGVALAGKFNANSLNPYDLLQSTNINTLISLRSTLKKEVEAFEVDQDEFTATDYQRSQNKEKKKWERFLYLLVGYKRRKEQAANDAAEATRIERELKILREENMTPKEKELEALKDSFDDEFIED